MPESPLILSMNSLSAFAVKKRRRTSQVVTHCYSPWCPSLNRSPSSGSGQTHQSFALSPTHVGSSKVVVTPSNKGKLPHHLLLSPDSRPLSLPHFSALLLSKPPGASSHGFSWKRSFPGFSGSIQSSISSSPWLFSGTTFWFANSGIH